MNLGGSNGSIAVVQRQSKTASPQLSRKATQQQTIKIGTNSTKFTIQLPISREILKGAEYQTGEEFTTVAYSAVTCEPEEFIDNKYTLRTKRYERQIRCSLVITMYNEDENLFIKTILSVQRNIAYLCHESRWGKEGWRNFVIVVVSDGRKKVNPRVLKVLKLLGCFVDGIMRTSVDGALVSAHIFEFTSQVAVNERFEVIGKQGNGRMKAVFPTQIVFVLKERNQKKINSHKWFFMAICETIKPEICMLLDVGTKPDSSAFWHLYRSFERNSMIGGACGEIKADIGRFGVKLLNPLVASQNFEYKMSNILDKPLESIFGYISVLPGAFSAYRYQAIQGHPLKQYFLGENPLSDIFTSNLYLAEDRILCFELVTKKDRPWLLKYVKSARAETDVPETLDELTSQRRRWLNGSFFASLYALYNFKQILASPHSLYQKLLFTFEFAYNLFNLYFTWFALANSYLSFYFLFDIRNGSEPFNGAPISISGIDPFYPYGSEIFDALRGCYIFAIVAMFITALGNRPQGSKWLYYCISILFSIIMALMIFMGAWGIVLQFRAYQSGLTTGETPLHYVASTPAFRDIVITVSATYGVYVLSSLLHFDIAHLLTSMIQYLLMILTYTNIFMVYAFTNLQDVSWGTKGSTLDDNAPAVLKVGPDGTTEFLFTVSTEIEDVDRDWKENARELGGLVGQKGVQHTKRDDKTKKDDGAREFRTAVVLSWILCNLALIVLFTNQLSLQKLFPRSLGTINPYLTFLFWSIAVLSMIRGIGSFLYMIQWTCESLADLTGRVTPSRPSPV